MKCGKCGGDILDGILVGDNFLCRKCCNGGNIRKIRVTSILKFFSFALLAFLISNCGTIKTWKLGNPDNIEGPISARELSFRNFNYECNNPSEELYLPYVYSGVKNDFLHITWVSKCGWAGGEVGMVNNAFYMLSIPFVVIDIPISFVADTLMLPITMPKQKKEGNLLDPPYFKMGNQQREAGNMSKAKEYYEKGFKILPKYYGTIKFYEIYSYLPDFDDVVLLMAQEHEQRKEYIKAIYYYDNLVEMALHYQDGPSGPAEKRYMDLGRVYSKMGNAEKTAEFYNKANYYRLKYNKNGDNRPNPPSNELRPLTIVPMNK